MVLLASAGSSSQARGPGPASNSSSCLPCSSLVYRPPPRHARRMETACRGHLQNSAKTISFLCHSARCPLLKATKYGPCGPYRYTHNRVHITIVDAYFQILARLPLRNPSYGSRNIYPRLVASTQEVLSRTSSQLNANGVSRSSPPVSP